MGYVIGVILIIILIIFIICCLNINDDILYKIDSEIGKDKKVVELQREIERLNQEIRCLNNCIIELHSELCNKQTEINRLNNIININK